METSSQVYAIHMSLAEGRNWKESIPTMLQNYRTIPRDCYSHLIVHNYSTNNNASNKYLTSDMRYLVRTTGKTQAHEPRTANYDA